MFSVDDGAPASELAPCSCEACGIELAAGVAFDEDCPLCPGCERVAVSRPLRGDQRFVAEVDRQVQRLRGDRLADMSWTEYLGSMFELLHKADLRFRAQAATGPCPIEGVPASADAMARETSDAELKMVAASGSSVEGCREPGSALHPLAPSSRTPPRSIARFGHELPAQR